MSELAIYFLEGEPLLYDDDGCYQLNDDGTQFRVDGAAADQVEDWRAEGRLSDEQIHGWLRVT